MQYFGNGSKIEVAEKLAENQSSRNREKNRYPLPILLGA